MASPTRFDVVGIGNAIVDVLARTDDDFLVAQALAKGSMRLIDELEADRLYGMMGSSVEASGGSAANTIAGIAGFGGKAAFLGRVRDDGLGRIFSHDIRALGIHYPTSPAVAGAGTARCLILVTPDGERTMNTYLGAAQELTPDDMDEATIASAGCTYLEGYLWDPPQAKEAFLRAARIAHANGRQVALSLSDSFCVDRYRAEFLNLMREGIVDIVFANSHEVRALYETADLETALGAIARDVPHAIVTKSEDGVSVLKDGQRHDAPAWPVDDVLDLTGAGDLFAAGYLFGIARGGDIRKAARLGAFAAAQVIGQFGARPQASLAQLAEAEGLLPL